LWFTAAAASGPPKSWSTTRSNTRTYPSTWSHYKVLILGTGGSGKSTNFKHCTIIGDGVNEDERSRSLVSAGAPQEATEEEVALLMAGGGAAEMALKQRQ
jgi:hypothetical protein